MKALVRDRRDFAGIVGTKTTTVVNGVTVCIGDVVKVAEGSNNDECEGVVGIITDKISVMGLGATPISELEVVEIIHSHKNLEVGSSVNERKIGYHKVKEFLM